MEGWATMRVWGNSGISTVLVVGDSVKVIYKISPWTLVYNIQSIALFVKSSYIYIFRKYPNLKH